MTVVTAVTVRLGCPQKYYSLNVEHESIRQTIYKNTEFSEYGEKLDEAFAAWKTKEYPVLSTLDEDVSARELIVRLTVSTASLKN